MWKEVTWVTQLILTSWMELGACSILPLLMFSFSSKLLLLFLSFKYYLFLPSFLPSLPSFSLFSYLFFFFLLPLLLSWDNRSDKYFRNLNAVISLMEVLFAMLSAGVFLISLRYFPLLFYFLTCLLAINFLKFRLWNCDFPI